MSIYFEQSNDSRLESFKMGKNILFVTIASFFSHFIYVIFYRDE